MMNQVRSVLCLFSFLCLNIVLHLYRAKSPTDLSVISIDIVLSKCSTTSELIRLPRYAGSSVLFVHMQV